MRAAWHSKFASKQIAWMAICVIVLQTTLTAWASHASATPTVDAFGNPLCITSTDGHEPDDRKPSIPNCCALGCAFTSQLVTAPDFTVTPVAFRVVQPIPALAAIALPAVIQGEHDPGSPRAPPTEI